MTSSSTSSGSDSTLGLYDELALTVGPASSPHGVLAVRYYSTQDAFVFLRRPVTADLPVAWPSFSLVGTDKTNTTKCLGWAEHVFFPGQVLPRHANTNPHPMDLRQCGSGGPLFLFDIGTAAAAPAGSGPSMVLSPISHFTTQQVVNCPRSKTVPPFDRCALGVSADQGACGARGTRCWLFNTSSVVLARAGLTRATRAFGALLRRSHGTTRMRGPGVTQLSYWNDNQAGYSWWTAGDDQSIWGTPEDIYLKLKAGYDAAGVPIRGWEPDNNWNVTYQLVKNWKGRSWEEFNRTLYPSGGRSFVEKLGNLSMTYYTNGFVDDNAYKALYSWTKENEPHPNASHAMYHDIIGRAKARFNMEMLFTDFLCYRGPSMQAYQDVGAGEEGGHKWLAGMTLGAQDHGVEVQYCMALAHQILESAEFPAVTNARVNGDGGLDVMSGQFPALLAATVGLGWSKDNLRTADRCYVDGLYPNGTEKWPCGSINKGEGTSGQFRMQAQQTMLAALSLGPVGIADQLSSYPTNESATITSNVTLVLATCAATGDLLQPSYPLVALERSIAGGLEDSGVVLWGTYTAVGGGGGGGSSSGHAESPAATDTASSRAAAAAVPAIPHRKLSGGAAAKTPLQAEVSIWYTAMAFVIGKAGSKAPTVTVTEQDLAPMVDAGGLPTGSFADIPSGAFIGAGATFVATTTASGADPADAAAGTATAASGAGPGGGASSPSHVAWINDFLRGDQASCGGVEVSAWTGAIRNVSVPVGDGGTLVNVAPVMAGGKAALLGEANKVSAMSTYRFSSVASTADGSSLVVGLRGKPGEVVHLLFATITTMTRAAAAETATATAPPLSGSTTGNTASSFVCKGVDVTVGAQGTATYSFNGGSSE